MEQEIKLTKSQQAAVDAREENVIVSAGAGTGKTRVLVERFIKLVADEGFRVEEILALTFTEKAAAEMKTRILKKFREKETQKNSPYDVKTARRDLESAYISTMHAFAARVLREHPVEAGLDPEFRVVEEEESDLLREEEMDEILEKHSESAEIFELLKIYGESTLRTGVLKIYEAARTEGKSLSEYFADAGPETAPEAPAEVAKLFAKVGEAGESAKWKEFTGEKWNWKTAERFKEWCKPFSRKGGKETKEYWKEINRLVQDYLAAQIGIFAAAPKAVFRTLALAFEEAYERRKKEESVLDFDDLQIRALQLFLGQSAACKKIRGDYQRQFKFIMIDESQDTSPLQIKLVEALAGKDNLFYVGDAKQSIYLFRGVQVSHFVEMEKKYRSIPLLENFRTESTVLEFINRVFENLWSEDDYVFQALLAKRELEPLPQSVELLWTEIGEDEGMDEARFREAGLIAQRIQELKSQGVEYGDIAILFQAMTTTGIYEHTLRKAGIPYFVVAGRGFYNQPEIRDMMGFLSCLENPLHDIHLAATLRSPFFRVTDDTLFSLSQHAKQTDDMRPLYRALADLEKIGLPEEEKQKLRAFSSLLKELLEEKDRLRLADLLDVILGKTSYDLVALADEQGVRRYANLKKLVDLAREYESLECLSLGDFIRTVRGLENREVRESEAQIETEKSGNVVRLMSVHKAKGLEFPVVFLADLSHQRQKSESKTVMAGREDWGLLVRNEETLDWEKPLGWQRIAEAQKQAESEEWKRLFYVAMTRAEKRLILSGIHKPKKTEKEFFREMTSWMEWVMTLKEQMPEIAPAPARKDHAYRTGGANRDLRKLFTESWKPAVKSPEWKKSEEILQNLVAYERPLSRVIDLPVSAYGSFLKSAEEFERVYEMGLPAEGEDEREDFTEYEEEEISAADFGTAIHFALEQLDFQNPKKHARTLIAKIFREYSDELREEAGKILEKFIASPLFAQIRKAKRVYRELPFVLNERHGRIDGVIDLLFQDEAGEWHVIDYKTAVGDESRVKAARYDFQIALYALAIRDLLGVVPRHGVLYFLKNEWTYSAHFDEKILEETAAQVRQIQDRILGS